MKEFLIKLTYNNSWNLEQLQFSKLCFCFSLNISLFMVIFFLLITSKYCKCSHTYEHIDIHCMTYALLVCTFEMIYVHTREKLSRILTLVYVFNSRIHETMRFSNRYGYRMSTTCYVTYHVCTAYYEVVLSWTWNTNKGMGISLHATSLFKNNEWLMLFFNVKSFIFHIYFSIRMI